MNTPPPQTIDVTQCPLCRRPNDCRLCAAPADNVSCWCAQVEIPEALLAQVPAESRNKSCLCRDCVTTFHRSKNSGIAMSETLPSDFYFHNGLMVFTAAYHLRRGYCCGSGCRHCPYSPEAKGAVSGH
jgi:hypothetical protein